MEKYKQNKDKLAHFVSYFPFLTIITKFICTFVRIMWLLNKELNFIYNSPI